MVLMIYVVYLNKIWTTDVIYELIRTVLLTELEPAS